MASIQNVITTTFRARGNQAIATMGSINQGFGRIGSVINQNTKASERLNNQFRAIGTTIRYAIAGTAVFGLMRMVDQLKEVQKQAGLVSAIGELQGGRSIVGNDLRAVMDQAREGAVQSLTPITDYNNAVVNLLSTISGVKRDDITPMVTEIARAAQLAQVNAEDATRAFTTMNVAFGQQATLKNVHQMAQEFFILTREAPGGVAAGQQIITQLGQLAQVTRAAHGTPEDMFGLLLSVLRSGIPPAQSGRGLQFLIQTLGFPGNQVPESRRALASVGITPNSDMNLQQRLAAIFNHARRLGMTGDLNKLNNLDEDTLSEMEANPQAGLSGIGITGRGAQFLGTVFRRIHALRTALALLGQTDMGNVQQDLQTMNASVAGHVSDVNDLSKAWKKFHDQAKLQEASIALSAMSLQVAQTFEPVLNFAAGKLTGLQSAMQNNPKWVHRAAIGGVGFMAALGVGKALGITRMLPGPLQRIFGGSVGSAFVGANAAQAALSGNAALGASPQNPLYVVVVGEIFGQPLMGGGTRTGGGRGGGRTQLGADEVAEGYLGYRGLRAVGRFGKRAVGLGERGSVRAGLRLGLFGGERASLKALGPAGVVADALINAEGAGGGEQGYIDRLTLRRAQANFGRNVVGVSDVGYRMFHGKADVQMTIKIAQNGKITKRRVHVPMDLWGKTGSAPTSKGKASKRGG
jgi:hypothetical protein